MKTVFLSLTYFAIKKRIKKRTQLPLVSLWSYTMLRFSGSEVICNAIESFSFNSDAIHDQILTFICLPNKYQEEERSLQ